MAPSLTPQQRSLRAKAAAYALHAQGGTSTAAGTAAFLARFERQVDPDGSLQPEERSRRAAHARKSYMAGLALKASRTRSRKVETQTTTPVDETSGAVSARGQANAHAAT